MRRPVVDVISEAAHKSAGPGPAWPYKNCIQCRILAEKVIEALAEEGYHLS